MGQCRNCGKKGFFLFTDKNGLCSECQQTVLIEVKQRARIIGDSIRLVDEGKTAKTRLSRCDLLLEHAEHLMKYERKGIPTISPEPSKLRAEYGDRRDQIIVEEIDELVEKAQEKARLATTPRAKVTALNSGLLKVQEIGKDLREPDRLRGAQTTLRTAAYRAELDGYLEAARKAEFKGNVKKALDQYKEALYLLKTDDICDDIQASEIAEIETEIRKLEGGS
jgi:hypothetical protein